MLRKRMLASAVVVLGVSACSSALTSTSFGAVISGSEPPVTTSIEIVTDWSDAVADCVVNGGQQDGCERLADLFRAEYRCDPQAMIELFEWGELKALQVVDARDPELLAHLVDEGLCPQSVLEG